MTLLSVSINPVQDEPLKTPNIWKKMFLSNPVSAVRDAEKSISCIDLMHLPKEKLEIK